MSHKMFFRQRICQESFVNTVVPGIAVTTKDSRTRNRLMAQILDDCHDFTPNVQHQTILLRLQGKSHTKITVHDIKGAISTTQGKALPNFKKLSRFIIQYILQNI